jgi:hypothetical protein
LEIHRIGIHFKTEIVNQACHELELHITNGQVRHNRLLRATNGVEDVEGTIRDLFPKMPEKDMRKVIKQGWTLRKVSNCSNKALCFEWSLK